MTTRGFCLGLLAGSAMLSLAGAIPAADEADAKRLVDFAAGLAFGLRGTIERVTHRVFLLSPANVQVTAEEKAKIAEGGYSSQG